MPIQTAKKLLGGFGKFLPKLTVHRPGTAPGTLQAPPDTPPPSIDVIAWGPDEIEETHVEDVAQLSGLVGKHPVTWVNVVGLGDVDVLSSIGEAFGLHALALEDVVHIHQRPKVETYDDHDFVVLRMITVADVLENEQVSLVLGPNYVITFQERAGDVLDPVRERVRKGRGRIRGFGPDYLAYAVLDAIIDHYFPVLEALGDRLEDLEEAVLVDPTPRVMERVYRVKRDLINLRRSTWPLRDTMSQLYREPSKYVREETRPFLRDAYDHTLRALDMVESMRDLASSLMDLYMSSVGNKTNEVMKVLTIIATIFIPLGFIAGLYGMNFDPGVSSLNMPELGWRFGYLYAVGLMAAIAGGMVVYFVRKGWIGGGSDVPPPGYRREEE